MNRKVMTHGNMLKIKFTGTKDKNGRDNFYEINRAVKKLGGHKYFALEHNQHLFYLAPPTEENIALLLSLGFSFWNKAIKLPVQESRAKSQLYLFGDMHEKS